MRNQKYNDWLPDNYLGGTRRNAVPDNPMDKDTNGDKQPVMNETYIDLENEVRASKRLQLELEKRMVNIPDDYEHQYEAYREGLISDGEVEEDGE